MIALVATKYSNTTSNNFTFIQDYFPPPQGHFTLRHINQPNTHRNRRNFLCDTPHYNVGVSTNNRAIDWGGYLIPEVAFAFSAMSRTSCNSSELNVILAAPRFSVKY